MSSNVKVANIAEITEDYMKKYGKKVIEDRAIPALIDGLKPVQRRILYSMYKNKQISDVKTVKSARVVGYTMGVYHPHGDKAIYDSIVNMVMPWNNIIPLIKGEGNFSNVEGDPPGAMRYTEITVPNKIAKYLLEDLHLTEYKPNYDNKEKEPVYLLPKVPFILFNGTIGIAFAVKTVIPQYSPEEIMDLLIFLIDKKFWNMDNNTFKNKYEEKMLEIFKGPDSSTGCIIELTEKDRYDFLFSKDAKAKFIARYEIDNKEKEIIIKSLIPEMNSKKMYNELLDLYIKYLEIKSSKKRNNKLTDNRYLIFKETPYNLSKNQDVKIVLKYKKTDDLEKELIKVFDNAKNLTKQINFKPIFLDIKIDGEEEIVPINMSLFDYLIWFLKHRKKVLIKKLKYIKRKLEEEIEYNNLLLFTINNLDKIQKLITDYVDNKEDNIELLYTSFKNNFRNLDDNKIKLILSFNLLKIANINKTSIENKIQELTKEIEHINLKLNNDELLFKEIKEDFKNFKKDFKDLIKRKSIIRIIEENNKKGFKTKDVTEYYILVKEKIIGNEKIYYIQKVPLELINKLKNDETIIFKEKLLSKDYLLFITNKGKLYNIKVNDINIVEDNMLNYIETDINEKIIPLFLTKNNIKDYLLFITKDGYVKLTETSSIKDYFNKTINKKGKKLYTKEKELISVFNFVKYYFDVLSIYTMNKHNINFYINEVPIQGLIANGVIGIKLNNEDFVIGSKLFNIKLNSVFDIQYIKKLLENNKIKFNQGLIIQKRGGKGKKIN